MFDHPLLMGWDFQRFSGNLLRQSSQFVRQNQPICSFANELGTLLLCELEVVT